MEGGNRRETAVAPQKKFRLRLRRLTWVDIAFLHFKAALAFMLYVPLLQSPSFLKGVTGMFFVIWLCVTVAGFLVSIFGLILGAQRESTRHTGFRWEMVGLWLILAGPAAFLGSQIGLWLTPGVKDPSGLAIMFPYLIIAAILARMAMIKAAMKTVLYRFPGEKND